MLRKVKRNWVLAGAATLALGCGTMWIFSGDEEVQASPAPRPRPVNVVIAEPIKGIPKHNPPILHATPSRPVRPPAPPVVRGERPTKPKSDKPAVIKTIPKAG